MKRSCLLFLLFTALFCLPAHAFEVTRHMSGSWYNTSQEGHGISLEVLDDGAAVFYWYVYNPDGTPTFLIGTGQVDGQTIIADAWHQTGMRWGVWDEAEFVQESWGQLQIDFQDCNHATLIYSSDTTDTSIPHGQGSIPMERLTSIDQTQCADNRSAGIYTGSFEAENEAWAETGTLVLAPDGQIVAFIPDHFAAFGTYGMSEAQEGEFWLEDLDVYPFGGPKLSEKLTANGSIKPEDRIVVDHWQIWQWDQGDGELAALDAVYREGLDFSRFMGSTQAEDLVTGETGWADVYPTGEGLHVYGMADQGYCTYEGNLIPYDMQFNMMKVALTLTGCGEREGSYSGLAYQQDPDRLGDYNSLVLAAHNGTHVVAFSFTSMY